MRSSNLLFLASWVILLVLSGVIVILSAQSLRVAYTYRNDSLTQEYTLKQIEEQGGEQAAKAFRGRRVTAATWAIASGLMSVLVIWFPYRRGEKWAWWALFLSLGLSQLLSLARALVLATIAGTSVPAIILSFLFLGLLAGAPRMFGNRAPAIE